MALTRTAAAAAGLLRLLFSSTEARVFMALRLQVDQPAGHRIAILSLRVKPCWVVLCEFTLVMGRRNQRKFAFPAPGQAVTVLKRLLSVTVAALLPNVQGNRASIARQVR